MKSHVSLERKVCPVCCTEFDSGAVLLDRRLKNSMERHTVTGWTLCYKCEELNKDGYIALVVARPSSEKQHMLKLEDADRTGEVIHMRRTVAKDMLKGIDINIPMMFIDIEFANNLKHMMPKKEKIA